MSTNFPLRFTIYCSVVALAIGGAAGVLGTALTSSYLSDYAVQLSELTAPLRLSQERPRNFPSSYKEAIDTLVTSSLPSIAEIYEGKAGDFGYTQAQRSAIGIVLTSDGWIAVHGNQNAFVNIKNSSVRIRSQWYPIEHRLDDPSTNTVFLKVNASGLPVTAFGNGSELQLGEQLFVTVSSSAFVPVSVIQIQWPDAIAVSSDEIHRTIVLDQNLDTGTIVFNLNGEMVGVVQDDHSVLMIEAVSSVVRSLLEKQTIIRPSLGVMSIDIAHAINLPVELSRSYTSGALLSGAASVPRTSVAKDAGLQPGDILLSVNGELINETHSLDELIAQYRPADSLQIVLDRGGQQQTIEVVLGEKTQ